MHVSKRMMQMTRLEPLIVLDASLAQVIGKWLIPVHSFKMEKW
jgi:hypothetical protein